MPDIVVAMFTANYQSLYGVRDVMRLAQKARQRARVRPDAAAPCSRFPHGGALQEFQETQVWLDRVTEAMKEFYRGLAARTFPSREVIERVKVPQADYFGFGEKLAVVEQGTSDPAGMDFIYDKVASFLASDFKDVAALVGADVFPAAVETEPAAVMPPAVVAEPDYLYDVFVSHDRSMPEFVLDLVRQLREELSTLRSDDVRIFVDVGEIRTGELWGEQIENALLQSKTLLALLTPRFSTMPQCAREFLTFAARSRSSESVFAPARGHSWRKLSDVAFRVSAARSPLHVQFENATGPASGCRQRETIRLADRLNDMIAEAPPFDPQWALAVPSPEPGFPVTLRPVELYLIAADVKTHGEIGPTINMTCRVSNNSDRTVELERLELAVKRER